MSRRNSSVARSGSSDPLTLHDGEDREEQGIRHQGANGRVVPNRGQKLGLLLLG